MQTIDEGRSVGVGEGRLGRLALLRRLARGKRPLARMIGHVASSQRRTGKEQDQGERANQGPGRALHGSWRLRGSSLASLGSRTLPGTLQPISAVATGDRKHHERC